MAFRSEGRGGFGGSRPSGNRFGGNRGGFGGERRSFGGRDSGRGERRMEMHDVTCDKCGKQCQVPFKPNGSKPVFCSDCHRQNESSGSFNSRGNDRPTPAASGISKEQFNEINAKLDKILAALAEFAEEDADDELDEDMDLDSDDAEDVK